jgi:hypothetical protein
MAGKMNNTNNFSPFILMLILGAFIVSLVILFVAAEALFVEESDDVNNYSLLAIGFFGLALSVYMLMQTRRTSTSAVSDMPRVLTTLECPKCDFKNIRDFQRGDYIFKETGTCQKCQETMKITAIYREPKKKK